MLFPDQRIRSDGVEVVVVLGAQRPELEEIAPEMWLGVEGQVSPHLVQRGSSPSVQIPARQAMEDRLRETYDEHRRVAGQSEPARRESSSLRRGERPCPV
jgi:hypothetical protein